MTTTTTTTPARRRRRRDDAAYKKYLRDTEDARVARLFAVRALPRDVRATIEDEVTKDDWRARKARYQTRRARRRDLVRALRRLGCDPNPEYETDRSKMCVAFVRGETPPETTAKSVARREAELAYVYDWCKEFRRRMNETTREIERLATTIARETPVYEEEAYGDPRREAYAEAIEKVTGRETMEEYTNELAEKWTDFPEKWPWLGDNDPSSSEGDSESDDEHVLPFGMAVVEGEVIITDRFFIGRRDMKPHWWEDSDSDDSS